MLTRDKLVTALQQLPPMVSLDEVLDRVMLLSKMEQEMEQSLKGHLTSDSELEKRLLKWLS
jgi:hypothetical protein